MEFHRLLTPQDIRQQAADTGYAVAAASLPADLLQGHEVLREMQRQHAR